MYAWETDTLHEHRDKESQEPASDQHRKGDQSVRRGCRGWQVAEVWRNMKTWITVQMSSTFSFCRTKDGIWWRKNVRKSDRDEEWTLRYSQLLTALLLLSANNHERVKVKGSISLHGLQGLQGCFWNSDLSCNLAVPCIPGNWIK